MQPDELLPGLMSGGLIQPKRVGRHLQEAAERCRQMLKAPEKLHEVFQGGFTDYLAESGEQQGCW